MRVTVWIISLPGNYRTELFPYIQEIIKRMLKIES